MFRSSPLLRRYFARRKAWYSEDLARLAEEAAGPE
jgi:hypothetical protein